MHGDDGDDEDKDDLARQRLRHSVSQYRQLALRVISQFNMTYLSIHDFIDP